MTTPLEVLVLEDNPNDAELILQELRRAGFVLHANRVEDEAGFRAGLLPTLDVILADYKLPGFNVLDALSLLRRSGLDIPLIVVTGAVSEEVAVECMREGAADYLLKDRLARLGQAVEGAIKQRSLREEKRRAEQALRESEAQFRAVFRSSLDVILIIDGQDGHILNANPAVQRNLGYGEEALIDKHFSAIFPPQAAQTADRYLKQFRLQDGVFEGQEFLRADGSITLMDLTATMIPWGSHQAVLVTLRDANERTAATAQLEKYVDERTAALEAANKRLQELDRLKNKFVSDVSHELRTPVTNLGMYVYLAEHDAPENRAEHLNTLRKQMARLRSLVESILDLSRIEVGSERVTLGPVDLNEVIEGVYAAHLARAQAKGLQLRLSLADDLPLVFSEQNQLTQVVENLVANAINYTQQGHVQISSLHKPEQGVVCMEVQDTGMGIDETDTPYLFDRFYRGWRVNKSDTPGSGLGLSIVKEIVERHGGRIEIDSKVNVGSVFRVMLNVSPLT